MSRSFKFASLINVLVFALAAGLPLRLARADNSPQYFPETGHSVRKPFIDYFVQTGGIAQHGFPITDDYVDPQTGLLIQYFEKSRLEWHPGNPDPYKIQLGLLGEELGQHTAPVPISQIPAASDPNCDYFVETGHSVCLTFRDYYVAAGGLDRFGYPITEYSLEGDHIIQYFQRARMEWNPEKPVDQRVQLAPLGRQQYKNAALDPRRLQPNSQQSLSPGPVRWLTARGSVINSVAVSKGAQTTFVFVTDQLGNPIGGAAVTLVVHHPDRDQVYTLPPTSAGGTTFQTFTVPTTKAGTIVAIEYLVGYNGIFAQTRTSYLVWY